ncbi:hypothetical protein ACO2Q2_15945 [Dyella sp. KRB-257]|uniref:hypothetical protein n=1 Tax=Dyella sp. KRB-257 TaxID=3400915 RepID=UPI003BFAB74D
MTEAAARFGRDITSEVAIYPMGFIRESLMRAAANRGWTCVDLGQTTSRRLVAVGVAGAHLEQSEEDIFDNIKQLLPRLDAAVLCSGFPFEGSYRKHTMSGLIELFRSGQVPVHIYDQAESIDRNLALSDAIDRILTP